MIRKISRRIYQLPRHVLSHVADRNSIRNRIIASLARLELTREQIINYN